jgi:transposase-like protein
VVDVYLQAKRDGVAPKRFFKRLLRSHGGESRKIVTDKLRSYGVAHRKLIPEAIHSTEQYENNWAEQSHAATRVRERGMRTFKSTRQAQRFQNSSTWLGIWLEPNIIGISGKVRSQNGAGQCLNEEADISDFTEVNLSVPRI